MTLWMMAHVPLLAFAVFSFLTLGVLLYYLLVFARFSFHKPVKIKNVDLLPVSIVLSARNEAHNLLKTLPELLKQQYKTFEVVVVNDNSSDETEQVVRDLKAEYPHLKLVNLTSSVTNIQGKKFPLSIGIKSASYDLLLLTDADCVPSSPYWLLNMAKHFRKNTSIVLGYSTPEKKGTLMNLFTHYDNLQVSLSYFSYALAKIPYMGIGKNLAYTRSLFYEKRGFASQNHLPYGDDDLFINRVATPGNCEIEYYKEAFILSKYKPGFHHWFHQKTRYRQTWIYYKAKHKFLLRAYQLFAFLFYVAFALSLTFSAGNMLFLSLTGAVFVLKVAAQYLVFGLAAQKLNEKQVVPLILIFDLAYTILSPWISMASFFFRRKWKP